MFHISGLQHALITFLQRKKTPELVSKNNKEGGYSQFARASRPSPLRYHGSFHRGGYWGGKHSPILIEGMSRKAFIKTLKLRPEVAVTTLRSQSCEPPQSQTPWTTRVSLKNWQKPKNLNLGWIQCEKSSKLDELPNLDSRGRIAIGCSRVYKSKKTKNGAAYRLKSRLVAKGHSQEPGISDNDTFALVRNKKILILRSCFCPLSLGHRQRLFIWETERNLIHDPTRGF